ncbi:MAG: Flp pilus assembly complex ATPase component TadA [Oscillospiraceae bacterium]|nr:Flp pilus assembly complex ATPase component TadA [Oscillospiraceae bacterium]
MIPQEVRQALQICPQSLRTAVERFSGLEGMEELRLRSGRPVMIRLAEKTISIASHLCTQELLQGILGAATGHAIYAAQNMLSRGFVTIAGGHRLGICGTAVVKNGEIATLKDISSVNLRIARQIYGAGESAANYLWTHPHSTLILGAPGAGKTTLLRDIVRLCSNRFAWRICLVDERMELAACVGGAPQFDVGEHVDVLTGADKETSIEMLLRAMNPQWIALDEITAAQDVAAISRASYCGVRFLATAHAQSKQELYARPVYRALMEQGVFQNLIRIGQNRSIHLERMTADA